MHLILPLIGLLIILWAFRALLSPPRKHKDFSYRDQREATHRALSGGPPYPDPDDIVPPELKK